MICEQNSKPEEDDLELHDLASLCSDIDTQFARSRVSIREDRTVNIRGQKRSNHITFFTLVLRTEKVRKMYVAMITS